ncbi:MAG: hypothetical protein J6U54_24280 [Clostridiales bacterium]|nr:hypothetical protein [Clostridiales bacterium]
MITGILLASALTFSVPEDISTDFKSYMDYRCITCETSPQYKLQQYAWTDENGLRKVDDYYLVAMGSYYSSTVGDCFKITLDTGETFNVMIGDCKADKDTDSQHMYHPMRDGGGNVLEFIVDTRKLPREVRLMGTVSSIDIFEGDIESIEQITYQEKGY